MAPTTNSSNSAKAVQLKALQEAGKTSVWVGIAAGVAIFAVQAAVVAGKAVFLDGKAIVKSLK